MSVDMITAASRANARHITPEHGLSFVLLVLIVILVAGFAIILPGRFLSQATLQSIGFQLPVFGLLTLAMYFPIVSGGLNLATTFIANICGLSIGIYLAAHSDTVSGVAIVLFIIMSMMLGAGIGALIGALIAWTGVHSILITLAFMILLTGIGELVSRGGDVAGMPEAIQVIGHGSILGIPIAMLIFLACVADCIIFMRYHQLGIAIRFMGSNPEAARFSGVNNRRVLTAVYAISGLLCAVAGVIMLSRYNSVRVGHGESFLLISILACFLGGVNPFGGFGSVLNVFLALACLQTLSTGLNLMGINQHLAVALWGMLIIGVMIVRWYLGGMKREM